MTRLIFIRHAATDCVPSRLAGRDANVHLNAAGKVQGQRLARSLKQLGIGKIYSSPQPRARETAEFLAELSGETVTIAPQLDEIDYGEWSGQSFDDLRGIAQWRDFNSLRSCTRIPGGELMIEVQARVLALMEILSRRHPATTVCAGQSCRRYPRRAGALFGHAARSCASARSQSGIDQHRCHAAVWAAGSLHQQHGRN